ncbi:MAG: hypothetical protein PHC43_01655 [Candidatus Marinimicrobia bacterium]|nr:hypothetical protein [Candidatus Neomarinimicrobiota bacterium]
MRNQNASISFEALHKNILSFETAPPHKRQALLRLVISRVTYHNTHIVIHWQYDQPQIIPIPKP